MRGIFPGRFQPFSLKHLGIVNDIIDQHPDIDLTLGIADWRGPRTRDNFLSGDEAVIIARLTLDEYKLFKVVVDSIPLEKESTLTESLRRYFGDKVPDMFFSGSDRSLDSARLLGIKTIVDLGDDDQSPPRAREIRDSLACGSKEWKKAVAQGVIGYLSNPEFKTRLNSLEGGAKRPWNERK